MLDKIKQLSAEIAGFQAKSLEKVEQFRIKHLSKKETITALFDDFKTVPRIRKKPWDRIKWIERTRLWQNHGSWRRLLSNAEEDLSGIDLTMPGDPLKLGTRHPLAIVKNEILAIFNKLGFTISEGPEIGTTNNFSTLNFPRKNTRHVICRIHSLSVRTRTSCYTRIPHPCKCGERGGSSSPDPISYSRKSVP